MIQDGTVSDCPYECPLDDPAFEKFTDEEKENAEIDCKVCWWQSEEAAEAQERSDLYSFCSDWLRRREIGLEMTRDLLTAREELAIYVIWSHQQAMAARRMKTKAKGK
mgnify:CR=1 FL=1